MSALDSTTGAALSTTTSAADGTYTLTGLEVDMTVCIQFAPPAAMHLAEQFYAFATAFVDCAALTLSADPMTTIDASLTYTPDAPGPVSGTVYDVTTFAPVSAASVTLGANSVATDADGAYNFTSVPPGTVTLQFSATGYEPQSITVQVEPGGGAIGDAYLSPTTTTTTTTTTSTTTTTTTIPPTGTGQISGRVTADVGGAALAATVVIYDSTTEDPETGFFTEVARTETSPTTGDYTVGSLPAGTFLLKFQSSGLASEYYNDSYDPDWNNGGSTQLITMAAGQIRTGINAGLGTGASIRGRVTAPDGAGIRDITVTVIGVLPGRTEPVQYVALTDSTGNYSVRELGPGSYKVEFTPLSTVPYLGEWYNNASSEATATAIALSKNATVVADAQLGRTYSISGTLTGPGGPLQDVLIYAWSIGDSQTASTSATGQYRVNGLAAGTYCVTIGSHTLPQELTPASTACRDVVVAADVVGVDLSAVARPTISGRVTAEAGGAGIADVTVRFDNFSTTTDAAGNYILYADRVAGAPLGFHVPQGSPYASEWHSNQPLKELANNITLSVTQHLTINAALRSTGQMHGTITVPPGHSVAGIRVVATYRNKQTETVTDAAGNWRLSNLVPGPYWVAFQSFTALADEFYNNTYDRHGSTEVAVVAGGDALVNASLAVGGSVSGRLTTAGGVGIPNVQVHATAGFDDWTLAGGTTDSAGNYTVRGMMPGSYTITFTLADGTERTRSGEVAVALGAAVTGINMAIPATGTITGVVLRSPGVPAAGVYVSLRDVTFQYCPCGATTSANGTYSITAPAGSYRVELRPPTGMTDRVYGYHPNTTSYSAATVVTVAAGTTQSLTSTLPLAATLTGLVRQADGSPAVGATVEIDFSHSTTTDVTGRFTIGGLTPGQVTFGVVHSGHAPEWYNNAYSQATATRLTLVGGTVTTAATVDLLLGGTITGRVTDAFGTPIPNVCVDFDDPLEDRWCRTITLEDGTYLAPEVAPGARRVCFRPNRSGFAAECRHNAVNEEAALLTTVVAGGTVANIDGQLDPSGVIRGTILRADGRPLVDTRLSARASTGTSIGMHFDTTDADGGFYLAGMHAGSWTIEVYTDSVPYTATVTVVGGAVTTIVMRPVASAPRTLNASAGNAAVSLSWTAPSANGGSPITDYQVQYRLASASTWLTFTDAVSTSTTATVTGLTNNLAYQFRVAAKTANGVGVYTFPVQATPKPIPSAPGTPAGTPGPARVTLSWAAPGSAGGSSITDYVIQYRATTTTTWSTFTDPVSTARTTTVTPLSNGTAYVFRVLAKNASGTGLPSGQSAALVPRTAPTAPVGLTAAPTNARMLLSWKPPTSTGGSPITDYTIQYRRTTVATWSTFADPVTSAANPVIVTGLLNNVAYYLRVGAKNAAGTTFTAQVVATPRAVPLPPSALLGVPGSGRVTLTWTAPYNGGVAITDYTVQYKTIASTTWLTFADGVRSTTGAIVTGLVNKTGYVFRVAAKNATGTGSFATSASIYPGLAAAPRAPTATAALRSVRLTWVAPANGGFAITDYLIQRSTNGGVSWVTVVDPVSTATSYTVTGLLTGTSYVFRVAAKNSNGYGPTSPPSAAVRPT